MQIFSEKSRRFPIVLLSFWFLLFPAYLDFSILDDSDMTPSYPALGKIDQDDLILSSENREKILKSTVFTKDVLKPQPILTWISNPLDQFPVLNSKPLILRC